MCDIDPQIVCSLYRHRPLCALMCFCCICNKWSYFFTVESLYYFIGYGHIFPTTFYGKLFCMIYSIVGIPLLLVFMADIGDLLAKGVRYSYSRICCRWCRTQRRDQEMPPDVERSRKAGGLFLDEIGKERCDALLETWTAFRLKPFLHVKAVPNIVPRCATIPRNRVKLDFFPCKNCSSPFGSWARFLFNYECTNKHCCKLLSKLSPLLWDGYLMRISQIKKVKRVYLPCNCIK